MEKLNGVISNRLRGLFSKDDRVWTPTRPPDSKPMPKTGVEGICLSGGRRRKKK